MSWLAGLGSLSFLAPLALWAFASLPLLWWLLRLTPPSPKRQVFPALMLLRDLLPVAQSPARTPWWLLLLRLLILTCFFLGLARPVLAPSAQLPGDGPVILLVDNGWASGSVWPVWQSALRNLCQQAERERRDIWVIPTAPEQRSGQLAPIGPAPAITACPTLARLRPRPWPADHGAAQKLLAETGAQHYVYWFSDGLRHAGTEDLFARLRKTGNLTLYQDDQPHYLLQPPLQSAAAIAVNVTRADTAAAADILITAQDKTGRTLGLSQGSFKPRERTLTVTLDLPGDIRNQAARLVLQDRRNAGTVFLLDARTARHNTGLIGDEVSRRDQPLLNGLHYLDRALNERNNVAVGAVTALIAQKADIIFNTNERAVLEADLATLDRWVQAGGTLVQFAGPQLAMDQRLLPAPLRQNRRDLGGIFSWEKPQSLRPFAPPGPFTGLTIPPEVTIGQQLLADPSGLTGDTSWALLEDGTPLVTGAKRGRGHTIFFHIPASPGWSSLPLSGLFVQMLERLTAIASGGAGIIAGATSLPALTLLDGFGQLQPADAAASPLTPEEQKNYRPAPEHPPGYYGAPGGSRAFNLGQGIATLIPFAPDMRESVARDQSGHELRPWLLGVALLLFLCDMLLALTLRGLLVNRWRKPVFALFLLFLSGPLHAQTTENTALSEKIWLGHVTNGASDRTRLAAAGLAALAERVRQKTTVEQIGTLAIDLERDDLTLIPFLYWPLTVSPNLSAAAQQKLQDYFTHGGMILIDLTSDPENNLALRESGIPLPMLAPLTAEHPVMRTFYLLRDCPGRTIDDTVWSERDTSGRQDSTPAIFIGARDWASAWTAGLGASRQQERAMRCGLNLVMYALTGNYKMDQVHVPAILERLGR